MIKKKIITRTARLNERVAVMLKRFADDNSWSANTAMNQALSNYLTELGYDKSSS